MLLKTIMVILVVSSLYGPATKLSTDDPKIKPSFDEQLVQVFGDKAPLMKAIFSHESNLKINAINYNCIYNGRSTFCKKGDTSNAHSVDCSIAQINVRGKICPPELMTIEGNMLAAKKILDTQGLQAWVSFRSGAYKRFM